MSAVGEPACDYFLLLDGDHEVHAEAARGFNLQAAPLGLDSYMLREGPRPGHTGTVFENVRLVKVGVFWEYVGATHEVLRAGDDAVHTRASLPEFPLIHHADGGSKSDKSTRDRKLLEEEAEQEPNNARTRFYLGNTYRDLGMCTEAIEQYRIRTAMSTGWPEEAYLAQLEIGRCFERLGHTVAARANYHGAWDRNTRRQEAPYSLAKLAYGGGDYRGCHFWARKARSVGEAPRTSLFIESQIYKYGTADLLCLCSYYVDEIPEGAAACRSLVDMARKDIAQARAAGMEAGAEIYDVLQRSEGNMEFYKDVLQEQEAELERRGGVGVMGFGALGGGLGGSADV